MENAFIVTPSLSGYIEINRMSLNVKKMKYMIFRQINKYEKKSITVRFGNAILEQVKEQKFLDL